MYDGPLPPGQFLFEVLAFIGIAIVMPLVCLGTLDTVVYYLMDHQW